MKNEQFLTSWWEREFDDVQRLADKSDLLTIIPSPQHMRLRAFVAEFSCRGLVCLANGEIVEADHFAVGIRIPHDYLTRAEASEVVTVLEPCNWWHPNVRAPWICIGHMVPGLGLREIVWQLWEIITWRKYAPADGLNEAACQWARAQPQSRFPIELRPLTPSNQSTSTHAVELIA
jgi:hypothetical protein